MISFQAHGLGKSIDDDGNIRRYSLSRALIAQGLILEAGAALAVISGLSQYFFGIEFLRSKEIIVMNNGVRAITSSFVHYNSLGGYLVVVLSLAFAMLLAGRISKIKYLKNKNLC